MYKQVGKFVVWFLGLFNKVKVYNKGNLPTEGGYIIACTHTGWIDILNLGVSIYDGYIPLSVKDRVILLRFFISLSI